MDFWSTLAGLPPMRNPAPLVGSLDPASGAASGLHGACLLACGHVSATADSGAHSPPQALSGAIAALNACRGPSAVKQCSTRICQWGWALISNRATFCQLCREVRVLFSIANVNATRRLDVDLRHPRALVWPIWKRCLTALPPLQALWCLGHHRLRQGQHLFPPYL